VGAKASVSRLDNNNAAKWEVAPCYNCCSDDTYAFMIVEHALSLDGKVNDEGVH